MSRETVPMNIEVFKIIKGIYDPKYVPYLHRESKKQDTKLLAISLTLLLSDFKIFFTSWLGSKFAKKNHV